jgi:SAM-dependent methyltransferase
MGTPWNPPEYSRRHAYVFEYGGDVVKLLDPRPGERILDLGCGAGQLARAIADAGAHVTGLDKSPEMIAEARANFPDLDFLTGDAANFAFDQPFDAVFSNAALHWVYDHEGVARSVSRALRPGGRFVAELGGRGNIRSVVAAFHKVLGADARLPWRYPSVGEFASILDRHGLETRQGLLFDRPTRVEGPDGMEHWLEIFAGAVAGDADETRRREIWREISEVLRPTHYRDGVWTLDYRRLRIAAVRPGAAAGS